MYNVPPYIKFLFVTLVIASIVSLVRADWASLFISLFTLGLSVYAVRLCNQSDFTIPNHFLTASILFIYGTLFLGEVGDFYERFWWWDMILHSGSALGFGLLGVIVLIFMFRKKHVTASPLLIGAFAFCFAMAIGALWEIFEYGMDSLFGLEMQKSGLDDTMHDLMVDAAGALIASIAGYYYLAERKRGGLNAVIHEAVVENKDVEL